MSSNPKTIDRDRLFRQEELIADVTELVFELMEKDKVNKTELSQRLGTTKSHVTRLLSGDRNMTLRTVADLVGAFGRRVDIETSALSSVKRYRAGSYGPGERVATGKMYEVSFSSALQAPRARDEHSGFVELAGVTGGGACSYRQRRASSQRPLLKSVQER